VAALERIVAAVPDPDPEMRRNMGGFLGSFAKCLELAVEHRRASA
jgi:hypothetical protein